MAKKKLTNAQLEKWVDSIIETYHGDSGINFIDTSSLPVRGRILKALDTLFEVLFPGHTGDRMVTKSNIRFVVGDLLCQVCSELSEQIERAYQYQCRIRDCQGCDCRTMAERVTVELIEQMPAIREMLKGDVQAAYEGDPATRKSSSAIRALSLSQSIGSPMSCTFVMSL